MLVNILHNLYLLRSYLHHYLRITTLFSSLPDADRSGTARASKISATRFNGWVSPSPPRALFYFRLKLVGQVVSIDSDRYYINEIEKIIGCLQAILSLYLTEV